MSRSSRKPGDGIVHADRLVLRLVPAGAEPDVEAAAAHPIERGERLGEHRRRPQRLAEHERAEPHVGDAAGQRRERHDRVEARLPIGWAAVLGDVEEQVIRQPHRVETRRAAACA